MEIQRVCELMKRYSNGYNGEYKEIEAISNGQIRHKSIPKNEIILSYGQPMNIVLFVVSGSFYVMRHSHKGQVNIIGERQAPQFFASGISNTNEKILADVVSKTRCDVLFIETEYLKQMMSYDITISLIIIENLSQLLRLDSYRMDQIVFYNPYEKVLVYIYFKLISNNKINDCDFIVDEKKNEIALFLGISERSVYRVLSQFRNEKLIDINKGKIVISTSQLKLIKDMVEELIDAD